jgi:hypothetical protein
MFSAKNYGLPKDLIEAAKRVHEKQLEENLDKRIKKPKNKYPDFTRLSDALTPAFKKIKKQREEDLKSEEVQFTEEELAEAFAIFLEENFHVEMLTEEDLDYIFENEFPQWLEEGLTIRHLTPEEQAKRDKERRERIRKETLENEKKPMV